jgi:prevent-host-death family protein
MGLREANQRFSTMIKAVRRGEEVLLTERGKPFARLVPVREPEDFDAVIKRLEAEGFLHPATKPGPMPYFRPIRIRGPSIVQTLREERDES